MLLCLLLPFSYPHSRGIVSQQSVLMAAQDASCLENIKGFCVVSASRPSLTVSEALYTAS